MTTFHSDRAADQLTCKWKLYIFKWTIFFYSEKNVTSIFDGEVMLNYRFIICAPILEVWSHWTWFDVVGDPNCTELHQARVSLPRNEFCLFISQTRPLTFGNVFFVCFFLYPLAHSCRKSPRLRHGIRKPRPSSVELSTDLKDVSEGEDVFYTYRASVSSSKDSEGDSSLHQLVSVNTNTMCFSILLLWLYCLAPVVFTGRFSARGHK